MKDSRKALKNKKNQPTNFLLHFILLFLLPALLLLTLGVLYFFDQSYRKQLESAAHPPDVSQYTLTAYPFYKQPFSPYVSAHAALVMEDNSKVALFAKNPNNRFPTASTAKIMTALVSLEYFKPQSILHVVSDRVEGTVVGIRKGETFYFEDLLYGMMLPSGNDAAFAIAENYPGGVPAFVKKMNEKAALLHLVNTRYVDPAGLDDTGNFTTAFDLANLSSYALKNSQLATVASTKQKVIRTIDGKKRYEISNLNRLLGINGVTGLKTGFTQVAGGVLATSKLEKGHTFLIVVMKSQDRFYDTEALLSLVTNNIDYYQPVFRIDY